MKFHKTGWLALCLVFLSACNNGTDTPTAELTLTPSSSQVTSGSTVTLTATITEGAENVALVEFSVKDGDVISSDDGSDGSYSAESAALSVNTTFVATAKDEDSSTLGSAETSVTVTAAPAQANGEDRAVTTLAGVEVVGGGTPTRLAVTTEKLVVENGNAEKVEGSEVGGVATVGADGTFTFTPNAGFSGAASFRYRVENDANSDEAIVTVTVNDLPEDTAIVGTLAELVTATGNATVETIIIKDAIRCNVDNCIRLGEGQTLTASAAVGGVNVSNPAARIQARVEGDEPTEPTQNNITVINLGPNTTIEGIEIFGRDIFTAIVGQASELRQPGSAIDDPVPSTVTINDVSIAGSTSNAPLSIKFSGPPTEEFEAYYDLNIDGLTVTDVAANPVGISAFSSLVLKNSTIAISASAIGETGVSVRAYSGPTTATIENVTITSAKGGAVFSPLEIGQSSASGVLTTVVKNTAITFADGIDLANAAFPFYFNFGNTNPGDGKIIISVESTGNTSNTTSPDPIRWTGTSEKIEGAIILNGTSFSNP
jgi:hypothetical protein